MKINIFLFLALVLGLAGGAFGTTCPDDIFTEPLAYEIQEGDWLTTIAKAAYSIDGAISKKFTIEMALEKAELIKEINPTIKSIHLIHTGEVIKLPCLKMKPYHRLFNPPVVESKISYRASVIDDNAPIIETDLTAQAISEIEMAQLILPAPVVNQTLTTEEVVPVAEEKTVAALQESKQETKQEIRQEIKPSKNNKKKNYWVTLHVPEGAIKDIHEGVFPAVLAEKQRKDGRWEKRYDTSVQINKEFNPEIGIVYNVTIVTKNKPHLDSIIRINFHNGNEVSFNGEDYLTKGEFSEAKLPRKLKGKNVYSSLHASLPKKQGFLSRLIRPMIPLGPPVGMALMGNPLPLIYSAVGITSNKLASKQAQVTKSETDANQEARIVMLEAELDTLIKYLTSLEQEAQSAQGAQ